MVKRLIALFVSAVLLFTLVSCDKSNAKDKETEKSKVTDKVTESETESIETEEETAEETEEETEPVESEEVETDVHTEPPVTEPPATDPPITEPPAPITEAPVATEAPPVVTEPPPPPQTEPPAPSYTWCDLGGTWLVYTPYQNIINMSIESDHELAELLSGFSTDITRTSKWIISGNAEGSFNYVNDSSLGNVVREIVDYFMNEYYPNQLECTPEEFCEYLMVNGIEPDEYEEYLFDLFYALYNHDRGLGWFSMTCKFDGTTLSINEKIAFQVEYSVNQMLIVGAPDEYAYMIGAVMIRQ